MNEFIQLQMELLYHKYLYYTLNSPILSDYDYDMLERKSFEDARNLGFRADKFEDPEEREAHHVHWMVGFKEDSPFWHSTKVKYGIKDGEETIPM